MLEDNSEERIIGLKNPCQEHVLTGAVYYIVIA